MTMTAKKSDGRRQQQTSKSAKHVRKRSGRRRSASTQKHESASLAHQLLPPQRTRAATLPTRLHEARAVDAVEGIVNLGRAMSNPQHERQLLRANSSTLHTLRSPAPYLYRRKNQESVARLRQIHKRSLFVNPKDLQEVAGAALHQGEATVHRQVRQHEPPEVPVISTDLLRANLLGRIWYSGPLLGSNRITYE
jgi:hypothetical protein